MNSLSAGALRYRAWAQSWTTSLLNYDKRLSVQRETKGSVNLGRKEKAANTALMFI